jgi:hypothetical protein
MLMRVTGVLYPFTDCKDILGLEEQAMAILVLCNSLAQSRN